MQCLRAVLVAFAGKKCSSSRSSFSSSMASALGTAASHLRGLSTGKGVGTPTQSRRLFFFLCSLEVATWWMPSPFLDEVSWPHGRNSRCARIACKYKKRVTRRLQFCADRARCSRTSGRTTIIEWTTFLIAACVLTFKSTEVWLGLRMPDWPWHSPFSRASSHRSTRSLETRSVVIFEPSTLLLLKYVAFPTVFHKSLWSNRNLAFVIHAASWGTDFKDIPRTMGDEKRSPDNKAIFGRAAKINFGVAARFVSMAQLILTAWCQDSIVYLFVKHIAAY